MTELFGVIKDHFEPVERDLIVNGFHFHDIGTPKLSWAEFYSFVVASPPSTATHYFRFEVGDLQSRSSGQGWTPTRGAGGRGKPPPPPAPGPQQPMRSMRGQNLRDSMYPQGDPNRQITKPLAKAESVPLDQFRERMAQRDADYYARVAKQNGQNGEVTPNADP